MLDSVAAMNRLQMDRVGDPEIATRIASYEMAHRLQSSAPELTDLASETPETLELYGADPAKPSFASSPSTTISVLTAALTVITNTSG